jgi:hypothetical protein
MDRSQKRSHPVGLRLAILFMVLSAAFGLFVSIANLRKPFPVPGHLMGEPNFAAPNGLVKYVLGLVFILLFNVPLLYGGIAAVFNLGNAATSITLAFVSALFGVAGWGLYGFKNWARLLTLTISVFTFLPPMLGVFPPFFVDSYAAMTAFLPFVVPCGLMVFYLKREDVRQLFA